MSQIIKIKEIKGFSRVGAKVGRGCLEGLHRRGHASRGLGGGGEPWRAVLSPVVAEPGGPRAWPGLSQGLGRRGGRGSLFPWFSPKPL